MGLTLLWTSRICCQNWWWYVYWPFWGNTVIHHTHIQSFPWICTTNSSEYKMYPPMQCRVKGGGSSRAQKISFLFWFCSLLLKGRVNLGWDSFPLYRLFLWKGSLTENDSPRAWGEKLCNTILYCFIVKLEPCICRYIH